MIPIASHATVVDLPESPAPQGLFLSNGNATVLITRTGTGFTTVGAHQLNVWSGDRIEDRDGFFIYLRDLDTGTVWSAAWKPVLLVPSSYSAVRRSGAFEITRSDDAITTRMEICVHPGMPVELRRIALTNNGDRPRRIELTSYIEVCLASPAAHAAHPAFSKLFVQTGTAMEGRALVATRRPRARGESHPCMIHAFLEAGDVQYETDRARFLGRLGDPSLPAALESFAPLSESVGSVLDPVLCLRRVIVLAPGASVASTLLLGTAADRAQAVGTVRCLSVDGSVDDVFVRAREHETRSLRQIGLSETQAEYAQAVAAAMLYGHPALRGAPEVLARARGRLSDLERIGVSRSRPFAVIAAQNPAGSRLLPDLLTMHRYWRSMSLPIDLLVLCDDVEGTRARAGAHEGVCFAADVDIPGAMWDLIAAAARLVVLDRLPDLAAAGSRPQP